MELETRKHRKRPRRRKSGNGFDPQRVVVVVCSVLLGIVILGFAGYGVFSFAGKLSKIENVEKDKYSYSSSEGTVPSDGGGTLPPKKESWQGPFVSLKRVISAAGEIDDLHNGSLILVNSQNKYLGNPSQIVSIFSQFKGVPYAGVSSIDDSLQPEVLENLRNLLTDFNVETGIKNVMVTSAFRTYELQQKLYNNGDPNLVAKPGYSEHETGYAFDLAILGESQVDFEGTGKYEWVPKNAAKYGFVVRYTADKSAVTGIAYEPWHYRYVGIPHAVYMTEHNLCLEEYLTEITKYTFEEEHLFVTVPTNGAEVKYEIYYVPIDSYAEETDCPVYDRPYKVSGNNTNGFIFTYQIDG